MQYTKTTSERQQSVGFFRELIKDLLDDRRSKKFKKTKKILGFFYGFFLSLIVYHFVIEDLEFSTQFTYMLGIIICLFFSIGHAISQQVRCLGLLAMPTFCDKSGQRVLVTMVFAYIMAGPLNNITKNGSEVIRVFTCSGALVANLTKTRYELMFKPFQEALYSLKADTNEIKDTINSINDLIDPIRQEFESDSDDIVLHERNDYLDDQMKPSEKNEQMKKTYEVPEPSELEKQYKDKLRRKCEGILIRAEEKCKAAFEKSFMRCEEEVHWAVNWALCWPMRVTFICNLTPLFGGGDTCDSEKSVNSGFGKGYVYLTKSKDELKREFLNIKVNYKLNKFKVMPDRFRSAYESTKDLVLEFREKRRVAEAVFVCVRRLLAFSFLKILVDSQSYLHGYLTDIEHDNAYVSEYYRRIDARRNKAGKHTLLPLKKIERKKMIDLRSYKLIDNETNSLFRSLLKLVFEMIAASSLVVLDMVFYEALDVIRRHAKIDYYQTGHHDLSITVKGTGMIANLLRSVVDKFNFKKNITVNLSNEMCLPNPHKLDTYYLNKIYSTFLLVFVMAIFSGYAGRLRRLICSVFFRKREKRRTLYLYNETLRKRTAFFRYMKQKVEKMARENKLTEDLNFCLILRLKYKSLFGWLVWFSCSRRKCLICGEPETRAGKEYGCNTPGCVYVHCKECWQDIGMCYGCSDTFKQEDDSENDDAPRGYLDTDYAE